MWEIILMILGGLGLFLFAINNLSDTLKELLGVRAKKWMGYFTKNMFTAILSGIVITTILDSSSAVIIMTIVLVNAGALTFRQSIGIVMGANIGTTFSAYCSGYRPIFAHTHCSRPLIKPVC